MRRRARWPVEPVDGEPTRTASVRPGNLIIQLRKLEVTGYLATWAAAIG
jgi:hypothetical protein